MGSATARKYCSIRRDYWLTQKQRKQKSPDLLNPESSGSLSHLPVLRWNIPTGFLRDKDRLGQLNFSPDKDQGGINSFLPDKDRPVPLNHLRTGSVKEVIQSNDKAGPTT